MGKDKPEGDLFAGRDSEEAMVPRGAEGELDLLALSDNDQDLARRIDGVEKRIDLFMKIKKISLKLTKPTDWIIRKSGAGESLYLMERGAENIAHAWGLDITGLEVKQIWHSDDKGKYYIYQASGKCFARKLGRYIEEIGICSQRDLFLGKVGKEWRPVEEIDITNIMRKAVTNLYNRIIKRMVGLTAVTIEDLTDIGFDIKKIPVVDYGEGRQKAEASLPPEILKRRDLIGQMIMILAENPDDAKAILKEASSFKIPDPNDSTKKIDKFVTDLKFLTSEKWIGGVYGKVRDLLRKQNPEAFIRLFPDEKQPEKNGGGK